MANITKIWGKKILLVWLARAVCYGCLLQTNCDRKSVSCIVVLYICFCTEVCCYNVCSVILLVISLLHCFCIILALMLSCWHAMQENLVNHRLIWQWCFSQPIVCLSNMIWYQQKLGGELEHHLMHWYCRTLCLSVVNNNSFRFCGLVVLTGWEPRNLKSGPSDGPSWLGKSFAFLVYDTPCC